MLPQWPWFAATYVAVLMAELIGDRSLLVVGSLSARYGIRRVLAGVTPAFAAKSLVAVIFGQTLTRLPTPLIVASSAITFGISALVVAVGRGEPERRPAEERTWMPVVLTSFSAIFFTEWADFGQITTAMLSARFHAPVAVWLGATLALSTKGAVAATVGAGIRRRLTGRALRWGTAMIFLMLGAMSLVAFP